MCLSFRWEVSQPTNLIQVGDKAPAQTMPSPIIFAEDPAADPVSTIQQYLSYVRGQTGPAPPPSSSAQSGDSGVSARPSFPPGYYPGLARGAPAYAGQAPNIFNQLEFNSIKNLSTIVY